MNREIIKLGLILFIICGIATALLAGLNSVTAPIIAKNDAALQEEYRKEVLPEAEEFEEISEGVYKGLKNNETVGYAVNAAKNGYNGAVKIMVGIKKDFTVSGIKILSHSETAGLGARCEELSFLDQFKGKSSGLNIVKTSPSDSDIQAISGATRTTRAVVGGVEEAIEAAKEADK